MICCIAADEVRIITPRKKLKTIPQPEPDVSVINVKNKLEEDLNKMGKVFLLYFTGNYLFKQQQADPQ